MKRSLIAAAWIAGTSIPLVLSVVFVFGCCVLPFHGVIHHVMPVCHMAVDILTGGAHHDDGSQSPMPAREKQEAPKRLVSTTSPAFRLAAMVRTQNTVPVSSADGYRSYISLGALRCDSDVGLHLFIATLLI